jgi:hypothetical protein
MANPYPTKPGFGLRVARATRILKRYGMGWSQDECGIYSRAFDNCFENFDGDAVVWALMEKAARDEDIAKGIRLMGAAVWPQWLEVYRRHELLKEAS